MSRQPTSRKIPPQILDEATTWFIEFSEGALELTDQGDFVKWLRTSPEHVRAYLEVSSLWEDTAHVKNRPATDQLVARALAESNVVALASSDAVPAFEPPALPKTATPAPPTAFMRHFAIAAALLLTIGAGIGMWNQFFRGVYSTEIGEQRSVRLHDGSTVELNSRSRIRVRLREHERRVELLEGQALFQVAKDESQPFIVATGDTRVRAVGTQFDVYRKKSGTVVTVVEGKVAVSSVSASRRSRPSDRSARQPYVSGSSERADADALALVLTAGEQLTVTPAAVARPKRTDVAVATAWTRREIVFETTPLSDVIEEFNRYNTQQLVIVDPALESTRINGVFSSTDPESLLHFLRELPNFSVQEANGEIRISARQGGSP